MAATTITARRIVKRTQNVRLRMPHILRGFGSGGRGSSSSIIFAFAGVIGVSGTIVVPPMADVMVDVNVDSMGDSIEVGDS